jgi:hypothetical protein
LRTHRDIFSVENAVLGSRLVLRWDPHLEPNEQDMEFRLTYAGALKAHRDGGRLRERSLHVHELRQKFHKQLSQLWRKHPVLAVPQKGKLYVSEDFENVEMHQIFSHDGFEWLPLVTDQNGLICKLEILMLRNGVPGKVLADIDNRLKTLFDALRMATGPAELGAATTKGQVTPAADEKPFYVLLQEDRLITHVAVTTDTLLDPVPDVPEDEAVRLVIDVTVRPYRVHLANMPFT